MFDENKKLVIFPKTSSNARQTKALYIGNSTNILEIRNLADWNGCFLRLLDDEYPLDVSSDANYVYSFVQRVDLRDDNTFEANLKLYVYNKEKLINMSNQTDNRFCEGG